MPNTIEANPTSFSCSRIVAVVDIGPRSPRLAIAQIDEADVDSPLETVSQTVSLGRDTSTKGVPELFRELQDEHQLTPRREQLLHLAALLHDVGYFVSTQSHHKSSMYFILTDNPYAESREKISWRRQKNGSVQKAMNR